MNNSMRRIGSLAFLVGAVLASALIVLKSGASFFYLKTPVIVENIEPDDGYAFRYSLNVNRFIIPLQGVLLFENDRQLERAPSREVIDSGKGAYFLSSSKNADPFIIFSSTDNTDPIKNERIYTLYLPLIFFSRFMGFIYMFGLIYVLARYVYRRILTPDQRESVDAFIGNLHGIIRSFTPRRIAIMAYPIKTFELSADSKKLLWKNLFTLSTASAFFYLFMEWLFFVTKPSFMDIMSFPEKLELFVLSGFVLALCATALLAFFYFLDIMVGRLKRTSIFTLLATFIPASLLSTLSLMLVDNFTYTVFNIGIVSTEGISRFLYGILFLGLFYIITRKILEILGLRGSAKPTISSQKQFYFALALLIFSIGLALFRMDSKFYRVAFANENTQTTSKKPHILLLGSDGLNAANMSVYGYDRDTTPQLRELAQSSLFAENAFPNAAHSPGSVISIMTSKLPTETRVLYPPDILKGRDSYQHLPGILKRVGYKTAEIGVYHYVDAYNMNMLNGFDFVNDRSKVESNFAQGLRNFGYSDTLVFLSRITERVTNRLSHIFFIKKMENPFTKLTQPTDRISDRYRMDQLFDLLLNANQPLFVHVHMMGTHGAKFYPENRVFSAGLDQEEGWMTDFYDDAVMNFDMFIGEVLDTLEKEGILDNTILVIYTDHGMKYTTNSRIPLLLHFPGGQHTGRIKANVQNLDIAPTLIDYLGLSMPDWMEGQSLLKGNLQIDRPIISTGSGVRIKGNALDLDQVKPPFYQFGYINFNICQGWYRFDLKNFVWSSGKIAGHSAPCNEINLPTLEELNKEVANILTSGGFDISSIP